MPRGTRDRGADRGEAFWHLLQMSVKCIQCSSASAKASPAGPPLHATYCTCYTLLHHSSDSGLNLGLRNLLAALLLFALKSQCPAPCGLCHFISHANPDLSPSKPETRQRPILKSSIPFPIAHAGAERNLVISSDISCYPSFPLFITVSCSLAPRASLHLCISWPATLFLLIDEASA